jgi:hypothetical protein
MKCIYEAYKVLIFLKIVSMNLFRIANGLYEKP